MITIIFVSGQVGARLRLKLHPHRNCSLQHAKVSRHPVGKSGLLFGTIAKRCLIVLKVFYVFLSS